MPSHLPLKKDVVKPPRSTGETSPVQVLNDTASKMSLTFRGMFKGVGEKLQSVQEGRKMNNRSHIPPWGAAGADGPSWEVGPPSVGWRRYVEQYREYR